ncbi:MAG: type I-U CRISPR-associated helicase/endonuclease Cas3 [bacterium]
MGALALGGREIDVQGYVMAEIDSHICDNADAFRKIFQDVTGNDPFPWQIDLYTKWFCKGEPPASCDLPTGLGKTSVIAIWLIALAHGARLPRRLAYVVNRRTVVDQATREVEKLRDNLERAGLVEPLQRLCATTGGHPLAISTLRGQYADNGQWYADPSRPAIICGTVDMIGSRLLFSGYRTGFRSRPLHAGFLAQDCLLVHDESHLEPAFQDLIKAIEREQSREKEHSRDLSGAKNSWPKLQVMALSATARGSEETADGAERPFGLTDEELNPPAEYSASPAKPIHHVWRRLKAQKQLVLHKVEQDNLVADKVVALATGHRDSGQAVLIYLRRVEDALTVAKNLGKELKKADLPQHVQTLTGTMRGHERAQLLRSNGIFARFMPSSSRLGAAESAEGTVYLVCTSAGEVGVDISADHMVSDLSTFDSMAQRFGRVNRFGLCDDTRADVVHPNTFGKKKKGSDEYEMTEMDRRRKATLDLFKQLNGDAGPLALSSLPAKDRQDAFAPTPAIPQATDILFDAWAMTTIRDKMPGKPPVAPYLHGLSEWEPPHTNVAWREEVDTLTPEMLTHYGEDMPRNLLSDYPLKPHELLNDTSERVLSQLQLLAKNHPDAPVWVVDEQNDATIDTLGRIADPAATKKQDRTPLLDRITDSIILLPPGIGGLSNQGTLDGKSASPPPNGLDVADLWLAEGDEPRRCRFRSDEPRPFDTPDGMTLLRTIDTEPLAEEFGVDVDEGPSADEEAEAGSETPPAGGRFWHWFTRPPDAEDATKASPQPVKWEAHIADVAGWAERIAERLDLDADLKRAIVLAARWHDLGKKRELWQRSIGNPDPAQWHAKGGKPPGGRPWRPRRLSPYRHEFGSLLDTIDPAQGFDEELARLPEDARDVVLHLIAAHHGYARPHFPPEATVDPNHAQSVADEAALEVPRRYARLQRRFGRWRLAYLESLLRAADWAASAHPGSGVVAEQGGER